MKSKPHSWNFVEAAAPLLVRCFLLSVGAILLASALNRILNAAAHSQALALPDPLLGIPLRYSLLLAGGFELAIALVCLLDKRRDLQAAWVVWLSVNYLIYRLGLIWSDCRLQCTCLGNPLDPLHLPPVLTGFFQNFAPVYLLGGSLVTVLWQWKSAGPAATPSPSPNAQPVRSQSRADQPSSEELLKMSCLSCGNHIAFPAQRLGQTVPCPHCAARIELRPLEQKTTEKAAT